jgi:hypothetical protein
VCVCVCVYLFTFLSFLIFCVCIFCFFFFFLKRHVLVLLDVHFFVKIIVILWKKGRMWLNEMFTTCVVLLPLKLSRRIYWVSHSLAHTHIKIIKMPVKWKRVKLSIAPRFNVFSSLNLRLSCHIFQFYFAWMCEWMNECCKIVMKFHLTYATIVFPAELSVKREVDFNTMPLSMDPPDLSDCTDKWSSESDWLNAPITSISSAIEVNRRKLLINKKLIWKI